MIWPVAIAAGWLVVAALAIRHGLDDPVVSVPLALGFVVGAWELVIERRRLRR